MEATAMKNLLRHLALSLALAPISGLLGSTTFAADTENGISTPKANVLARSKKAEPAKLGNAKRVAMFDAMDQGLISVEYIGKDSKQANIIFRNKSDESIDVVLPETFGAVPVVAQGMEWAAWVVAAWAAWVVAAWAAAKAWGAASAAAWGVWAAVEWVEWAAVWAEWAAVWVWAA
jgi:hypothetical protein